MSQTESGWLHHRKGAYQTSLHGEMRTSQSLRPGSIASNQYLPFTIVGYSLPCERHPERNEDSFLIKEHTGLIAVFDGVGGSVAGDIASQAARRATLTGWNSALRQIHKQQDVRRFLKECDEVDLCTILRHLIDLADETIRTEGVREAGTDDLATTVAIAALCHRPDKNEYKMVYGFVGDSRVYLLREGEPLLRMTADDGLLGKLIENEIINEEDSRRIDQAMRVEELTDAELSYFRLRGGITQALGGPLPPEIHIDEIPIGIGDRALLCTDGIHDNLTDHEIEEILRRSPRSAAARILVEYALQRSREEREITIRAKPDDMTAIVLTRRY